MVSGFDTSERDLLPALLPRMDSSMLVVADRGFGQDPTGFRLVTTILDPGLVAARELALAYARRWEIEGCFDELKTHARGAGLVLRSQTPSGVLQEIYGYLCVHYALRP